MLIGGSKDFYTQCSNKTWFFNHQNERWISGPDLGTGRYMHTAGIVKDRETNEVFVAVVGGLPSFGNALQSVELLDLQSKEYAWRYGILSSKFIFLKFKCGF